MRPPSRQPVQRSADGCQPEGTGGERPRILGEAGQEQEDDRGGAQELRLCRRVQRGRKPAQFLDKMQGNVDEIRATRDQKLTELAAALKTATQSEKFLKTNAGKEWTDVQLAYEAIQDLAKAGDYRGVIKKARPEGAPRRADCHARRIQEGLQPDQEPIRQALGRSPHRSGAVELPGRVPAGCHPAQQRRASRAEKQPERSVRRILEEASSMLKKLLDNATKLETETKALQEDCTTRRREYRRGIEGSNWWLCW